MTRTIQDIFKQFCKERHAEDKGKNYDLLQTTYAQTEFFDTTMCEMVGMPVAISRSGENYTFSFPIENFSLPFQVNFIRVGEETCIFLKEYLPNILTGAIYSMNLPYKGMNLNIPFTIILEEGKATISASLDIPMLNNVNVLTNAFHLVSGAILTLNELSNKSVVVDKPSNVGYHEYYRRKKQPTIKVPQRPIYYILGNKNEDITYKYNSIHSMGKLEYTSSFHVRGHWRTINEKSLGKDRNGNYGVHGYTWVTDYIKGEGELTKRLRVVK